MSYHVARQCFEENRTSVGDPASDHQTWNPNNGLANLTTAIEADLAQIKKLLAEILHALRQ